MALGDHRLPRPATCEHELSDHPLAGALVTGMQAVQPAPGHSSRRLLQLPAPVQHSLDDPDPEACMPHTGAPGRQELPAAPCWAAAGGAGVHAWLVPAACLKQTSGVTGRSGRRSPGRRCWAHTARTPGQTGSPHTPAAGQARSASCRLITGVSASDGLQSTCPQVVLPLRSAVQVIFTMLD